MFCCSRKRCMPLAARVILHEGWLPPNGGFALMPQARDRLALCSTVYLRAIARLGTYRCLGSVSGDPWRRGRLNGRIPDGFIMRAPVYLAGQAALWWRIGRDRWLPPTA